MDRRELLRAAMGAGSAGSIGFLAGCTGNGGSSNTTTTNPPTTTTEETTTGTTTGTERTTGPTVSVDSTDEYGDILVGPNGLSLYLFEKDTAGEMESTCYDSCATAWPPLTVSGEPTKGDAVTASLSTFERDDGTTQVAAAGWPLYYFKSDEKPGDTKGQEVEGFGAEWYLLGPDGSKKESEEEDESEEEGSEGDGSETSDSGEGDEGGASGGMTTDSGY